MVKTEIIEKCMEILQRECDDPAQELIKMGNALVGIGNAVKGLSIVEARATIQAAAQLAVIARPAQSNNPAQLAVREPYPPDPVKV